MHLGRNGSMDVNQFIFSNMQVTFDGRQWPFEQNRFLTKNPILNCDMSFVILILGRETHSEPQIIFLSFFDLQA